MLQKLFFRKQSASDFIARTRRMITFWDRYRYGVSTIGFGSICWLYWYLNATWQSLASVGVDDPFFIDNLQQRWMLISLFIGMILGLNVAGLLSYLVGSIVGGYRTERMLLKLHDQLQKLQVEANAGQQIEAHELQDVDAYSC